MVIFKKRLKEKRNELGLTQEELGKNIYLSKGEVCAYEKGKRIPPLDVLIKIAEFLEVDFSEYSLHLLVLINYYIVLCFLA